MQDSPSDPLIVGLAAGDARALEALYDRMSGRLYRAALGMLSRREDAEDAVQEVFVALVRSRRLGGDPRPGGVLVRIVAPCGRPLCGTAGALTLASEEALRQAPSQRGTQRRWKAGAGTRKGIGRPAAQATGGDCVED